MKEDLVYLAATIDGEGCVCIGARRSGATSMSGSVDYHFLRVMIGNTKFFLIDWIITNFGGHYVTRKAKKTTQKDCYQWFINGKDCQQLLKKVYPYLKLKQYQARLALEFPINKRGQRLSQKSIELRKILRRKMVEANS